MGEGVVFSFLRDHYLVRAFVSPGKVVKSELLSWWAFWWLLGFCFSGALFLFSVFMNPRIVIGVVCLMFRMPLFVMFVELLLTILVKSSSSLGSLFRLHSISSLFSKESALFSLSCSIPRSPWMGELPSRVIFAVLLSSISCSLRYGSISFQSRYCSRLISKVSSNSRLCWKCYDKMKRKITRSTHREIAFSLGD